VTGWDRKNPGSALNNNLLKSVPEVLEEERCDVFNLSPNLKDFASTWSFSARQGNIVEMEEFLNSLICLVPTERVLVYGRHHCKSFLSLTLNPANFCKVHEIGQVSPGFGNYISNGPVEHIQWEMGGVLGTKEIRKDPSTCKCSMCRIPDLSIAYKHLLQGSGSKSIPLFGRALAYEDVERAISNTKEFPHLLLDPVFASIATLIEHHKELNIDRDYHPAYIASWDRVHGGTDEMVANFGYLSGEEVAESVEDGSDGETDEPVVVNTSGK
jgi:hypothetical protein